MYKYLFVVLFLSFSKSLAQDSTMVALDSVPEKRWDVSVDLVSRYIWRGQAYGGNTPAVQPAFNYALADKWTVGVWGTTNFRDQYYYSDDVTPNNAYQEFDLGVSYQINDFMSISVWDYYWPSWHRLEGEDKSYFNYGVDGAKTVDATLEFDFSEGFKYPFNATISTFILGNDFRYDASGENPKQNFTTYVEAGYTFYDIFKLLTASPILKNINLDPSIGAVLNNQAGYYEAADYDRISFINMAVSANREFDLGQGLTMPVSLNYTHNAASRNTEVDGTDFLTVGVSLYL
ncbi:MAG TPA: TorF family putative porin [Flavobacterium sp.]|jgi:hypothetical protein